MRCYEFLRNEEELKRFHSLILPTLGQDEVFYLMLGARNKYLNEDEKGKYNMNGSDMIRRVTVRSNRYEELRDKVLDFCVPVGRYKDKNGLSLPEHSFTLYITPNARDARRASVGVVQKITEGLLNPNTPLKLENMVLSEIHKNSTNKVYMDFDVDPKEGDDLDKVLETIYGKLGGSYYVTVKTHSGAHVLLKKSTIDSAVKNTFYKDVQRVSDLMYGEVEIKGDTMLPVPGCAQGGKVPRIMKVNL
jgi:hypothetical protein